MFSTLLLVSRPAAPLGSAGYSGRSASQPSGSCRRCILSRWSASSGYSVPYAVNSSSHLLRSSAPTGFCCEMLPHFVRDEESLILWPAVEPFGALDLFDAQRLAVSGMVTLLGGRTVSDHTLDDDHGGPVPLGFEGLERGGQRVEIIGVLDPLDRPAVALETPADVLGKS